jgi:hypothetical protein
MCSYKLIDVSRKEQRQSLLDLFFIPIPPRNSFQRFALGW